MPHHVETDISVRRFGFSGDDAGKRLQFPRAELHQTEGRSGSVTYGAADLVLVALEGRLDTLRWTADAATIGGGWLRTDSGRVDLAIGGIELPRGIRLVRADAGVEIMAPDVTLSEVRVNLNGPFGGRTDAVAAPPAGLRQSRLRFLDSLSGHVDVTIKVRLDLPVLGVRTLDQTLEIPIKEGSLDFRALEKSLDWLEGRFLDIAHDRDKLAVTWKVPIFGSAHDLIAWTLDTEAAVLATFGRVPVRSLADFRVGEAKRTDSDDKKRTLQAFSLDGIDVALSLLAPRSVEAGGGLVMFGGDDQPGMVDLKVSGSISDPGQGSVRGAIGMIDTTIKDLKLGGVTVTADRMAFDGVDQLEVTFEGFRPTKMSMVIHRVTATNLALRIGGGGTTPA